MPTRKITVTKKIELGAPAGNSGKESAEGKKTHEARRALGLVGDPREEKGPRPVARIHLEDSEARTGYEGDADAELDIGGDRGKGPGTGG